MSNGSMLRLEQFVNLIPVILSVLFVLSLIFEVSKIKINPWTWIFKQISTKVTQGVDDKINDVKNKENEHYGEIMTILKDTSDEIKKLSKCIDENEMQRIRYEILDFANSCKNGRKHTQDEFHHIIEINQKYHNIISKRGLENGLIDVEFDYIMEVYRKCRNENSFL